MGLAELVLCRLLGVHRGHVETLSLAVDVPHYVEGEFLGVRESVLSIRVLPCSRCGGIDVVDVEPRAETMEKLGLTDEAR